MNRAIGLPGESLVQPLTNDDDRPDLVDANAEHFARLGKRYGVNAPDGATDLLHPA